MALPETVRVKLSPEDAGAITLAPVVVQQLRLAELVRIIVEAAGKDRERLGRILRAGTILSGATRYRWAGWEVSAEEIEALLAGFPEPEPSRPFAAEHCVVAEIEEASGRRLQIPYAVGAKRRFLRRAAFWDALMGMARAGPMRYLEYSYKERADCYRLELSAGAVQQIRAAAGLLAYRGLAERLRCAALARIDFYVKRGA